MRLMVTTPTEVVIDASDVAAIRAEDITGAFGILPGHAGFITTLTVSVISWHDTAGHDHHIAVRKGVLTVHNGDMVEVATREAVDEESLTKLGDAVLDRFRDEAAAEDDARTTAMRLHLATIRQLQHYLQASRTGNLQSQRPAFFDRAGEEMQ